MIGLVCFSIFFITFYFISLIEELGKLDISSYLLARVKGRFIGNRSERDDSRELTRKSSQGTFVLHLAGLLGLVDKRLTWCVRGLVMRLSDFREAGQLERE